MSMALLNVAMLICSVGSVKQDQTTCKMSQSAEACSAAGEQTDLEGEDAQSLMQVRLEVHAKQYEKDRKEFQELAKSEKIQEDMKVQEEKEDLEPKTEEIQHEMKEKEEKEEEEDLEWTTDEDPIPPALLDALRSLNTTIVNGRESVCHAEHFIAGFTQTKSGNFTVDCKPCAEHCRDCWGPTMRECVKCKEPLIGLLTRELPRPEFGCVEKCPVCYIKEEHGFCSLNRTCEVQHTATKESVPVNMNTSETFEIHKMTDGDNAPIKKDAAPIDLHEEDDDEGGANVLEIQANLSATNDDEYEYVKHRRRRRVSRRRSTRSTYCDTSVKKMKAEVSGWDQDCYTPARKMLQACDNRKQLSKSLKTYRKISDLVEKGTSLPIRSTLKALQFIPWGIGKGLSVIAKSAGIINGRAAQSRKITDQIQPKLDHFTLVNVCKKMTLMHKKVKKGVIMGSRVLDQFNGQCGCDCLVPSGEVDKAIETSKSIRSKCRDLPSFDLPTLAEVSVPSWVEDVLSFIGDIQHGLNSIMNHPFCISYFFGRSCFTIGHIIRAISWLLGMITGLVEQVVFGVLAALGLNLGCHTITDCINKYASQYLEKIPGLGVPQIPVPYSPPHWNDIAIPEFNLFALTGCAHQLKDVLEGSKYNSDTCELHDLHNGDPNYVSQVCFSRRRAYGPCTDGVSLDAAGVMAICPADEPIFASQSQWPW